MYRISKMMVFVLSIFTVTTLWADNWSQWNETTTSGISKGYLKVGFSSYYQSVEDQSSVNLGAQLEALISDHWGLGLQAYGQVYSNLSSFKNSSYLLSVKYHIFDRSPINLFLGSLAGLNYLKFSDENGFLSEALGASTGLSFYYWGNFYTELQTDYLHYRYFSATRNKEFNSFRVHLSLGMML